MFRYLPETCCGIATNRARACCSARPVQVSRICCAAAIRQVSHQIIRMPVVRLTRIISQLNELLSAAAILSGFELNIFKEGELPLQGGGSLAGMVLRYGGELAALAKINFEKAQLMTDKFVLAEPRILVKLTLVRGVLGATPIESNGGGGRGGGQFGRRPQ